MTIVIDETSEILTRKEASEHLLRRWRQSVSVDTLANYATDGIGPPFAKTSKGKGGGVFYDKKTLDQWALRRMVAGGRKTA